MTATLDKTQTTDNCCDSFRSSLIDNIPSKESDLNKFGEVKLCGKITQAQYIGQICFLKLKDPSGQLQLILNKETKGIKSFFDSKIKLGDIISATGKLCFSKAKVLSLDVKHCSILSQCTSIMPKKIVSKDFKMSHKYLEIFLDPLAKNRFTTCSLTVKAIREFLYGVKYLEFDTQLLKSKYGGGQSKPFKTHHNSLDREFFLRTTSELELKQLVIGGYEKVFELSKSFRNEGIDSKHYPEFTMLEICEAYSSCKDLMNLMTTMIRKTVKDVKGTGQIQYAGNIVNFDSEWHEFTTKDAILKYCEIDIEQIRESPEKMKLMATKLNMNPLSTYGAIIDKLLEKKVEPHLIHPTFITNLPVGMTPFAKTMESNPLYTDRAWFYAGGLDLCDIYSSLTDVEKLKSNFAQQDKATGVEKKYSHIRTDFIEALTYGAPPMANLGLSVSRLQMLLTDSEDIQDIILFPRG